MSILSISDYFKKFDDFEWAQYDCKQLNGYTSKYNAVSIIIHIFGCEVSKFFPIGKIGVGGKVTAQPRFGEISTSSIRHVAGCLTLAVHSHFRDNAARCGEWLVNADKAVLPQAAEGTADFLS